MTTWSDVVNYIKEQAKFVGKVFLGTTVGGIAGSVASGVLGYLTPYIPLVATTSHNLGPVGAGLGFLVTFLGLLVEKFKS